MDNITITSDSRDQFEGDLEGLRGEIFLNYGQELLDRFDDAIEPVQIELLTMLEKGGIINTSGKFVAIGLDGVHWEGRDPARFEYVKELALFRGTTDIILDKELREKLISKSHICSVVFVQPNSQIAIVQNIGHISFPAFETRFKNALQVADLSIKFSVSSDIGRVLVEQTLRHMRYELGILES